MKKNILLLFICCCFAKGFSQGISINLSFELETKEIIFLDSTFTTVPYLNITYKNDLNYPVYFPGFNFYKEKPSDREYRLSIKERNKERKANDFPDFSEDKYNVFIYNPMWIKTDLATRWEVLTDTIDRNDEHEEEVIENYLGLIYYCYAYYYGDENILHDSDSLFIDEYLSIANYKKKFVFLQPNESIVDRYPLLGFSILKGEYFFQFLSNQLNPIINTTSWGGQDDSKYPYREKELPARIGEYNLYKEEFSSNKIKIKFD